MNDCKMIRATLLVSVALNAVGSGILAFPLSPLGEALGLPGAVPPLYSTLCALFIGLFGAAYLWLARQPRIDRPLVAFAAVTKASVFTTFLCFWFADSVTNRGMLMVFPHLMVAAIFFWWLGRREGEA